MRSTEVTKYPRTFSAFPCHKPGAPSFALSHRLFRWACRNIPGWRKKSPLVKFIATLLPPWPPQGVVSLDNFGVFRADFGSLPYRNFFLWGRYEPHIVWYLEAILRPGDVFFDIGANFGLFTIISAKIVQNTGRVYSFEPLPEAHQYLSDSVALNGLTNVQLNRMAVGARSGNTEIYRFHHLHLGYSSLLPYQRSDSTSYPCTLVSLDDYVSANGVAKMSMIKIDVEGAERDVLYGARNVLERERPAIILEINRQTASAFGYTPEELTAFLADLGYSSFVYRLSKNPQFLQLPPGSPLEHKSDILCIYSEQHRSALQQWL
jgi:FkbM family methyltransferase